MSSAGSLSVGDAQPNQSAVFEELELKAYARRAQPTEAGVMVVGIEWLDAKVLEKTVR